jgi:hypothetical protein
MGHIANDRLAAGGYIDVLVDVNVLNDHLLPAVTTQVRKRVQLGGEGSL